MSAGDVKFVGWTGTNPNYQEMEPSFSYEPYRENRPPAGTGIFAQSVAIDQYIRVQMTRRIVCFNKDKASIISSLGFENVTNSLTYIDTDGSVKTKTVGAGWTLKTISESALAPGYSNINIMYEKVEHKGLAFPSAGISFICTGGVCKINYKGFDIETIDSGTGECTTGINAVVKTVTRNPNVQASASINPEEYQNLVYFKPTILCNNVESDFIEIKGSDLQLANYTAAYLTPVNTKTAKEITSEERTEFYNLAPLTQDQKNEILETYQSEFPNTEYASFEFEFTRQIDEQIKNSAEFVETETGDTTTTARVIRFDTEKYWDIKLTEYIKTKAVFKLPNERIPSFAFKNEGNVIKLLVSGGGLKEKIVWREWDVTGIGT